MFSRHLNSVQIKTHQLELTLVGGVCVAFLPATARRVVAQTQAVGGSCNGSLSDRSGMDINSWGKVHLSWKEEQSVQVIV